MRNVENALSDVVIMYQSGEIQYEIIEYKEQDQIWIVNVYNQAAPDALLQVEIIDDNGIPACCVLTRRNVGRRSMYKFMDRLIDALEN
jgi:alkyl hydroperoxide reductase subunit AhpC